MAYSQKGRKASQKAGKRTRAGARLFLPFIALVVFCPYAVYAQTIESNIKSGLIYNFLKYTHWPAANLAPQDNIHVCLLGGDPFEGALDPLNGRMAQKRTIRIHVINTSALPATSCHLVFIHKRLTRDMPDILRTLQKRNILTISDAEHFTRNGGMVEFGLNSKNRIHIQVNRNSLNRSDIVVEQRLLRLAEIVE